MTMCPARRTSPKSNRRAVGAGRGYGEIFVCNPPRSPGEALRWFVVGLVALIPAMLGTSLLFEVVGWSTRYGTLVGMGLGLLYLNLRREPRSRGTRHGD